MVLENQGQDSHTAKVTALDGKLGNAQNPLSEKVQSKAKRSRCSSTPLKDPHKASFRVFLLHRRSPGHVMSCLLKCPTPRQVLKLGNTVLPLVHSFRSICTDFCILSSGLAQAIAVFVGGSLFRGMFPGTTPKKTKTSLLHLHEYRIKIMAAAAMTHRYTFFYNYSRHYPIRIQFACAKSMMPLKLDNTRQENCVLFYCIFPQTIHSVLSVRD